MNVVIAKSFLIYNIILALDVQVRLCQKGKSLVVRTVIKLISIITSCFQLIHFAKIYDTNVIMSAEAVVVIVWYLGGYSG